MVSLVGTYYPHKYILFVCPYDNVNTKKFQKKNEVDLINLIISLKTNKLGSG